MSVSTFDFHRHIFMVPNYDFPWRQNLSFLTPYLIRHFWWSPSDMDITGYTVHVFRRRGCQVIIYQCVLCNILCTIDFSACRFLF